MNGQPARKTFSRLRAPAEDGGVLFEPPPGELDALLAENRVIRTGWQCELLGKSVAELSRQGREELLRAALAYTRRYRDVPAPPAGSNPEFLLAGHQPELFHPGVWLKNFALGAMAHSRGAMAVNLLVDTDTAKSVSLPIPTVASGKPQWTSVPFDRADASLPFEERAILDPAVFQGFGKRAAEAIGPLVANPMVKRFWPLACERAAELGNLGLAIAQARHFWEAEWGLETLEVPQSKVASTGSFRWFAASLLAEFSRFREVFNETVGCYRRKHGVRSAAHPFPDLSERDGWLETPFWIWTTADPRRRPLFATFHNGQVVIADGESREFPLPLTPEGDGAAAVERLAALEAAGVKIRPRAITTTLWARLALSDLFVHGIGGAKYDEVTDQLFERLFGTRPPRLVVVSGTLLLPSAGASVSIQRNRELRQRLWQLRHHPERWLAGDTGLLGNEHDEVGKWVAEKRRWIATPQSVENARQRCQTIRRANAALQAYVADERDEAAKQLREVNQALEPMRGFHWRELSFCLHSEGALRSFVDQALFKSHAIRSNKATVAG
ncbi:MAG: hypothetical protein U1E05_07365 [Patescibacteria group bacterium]|nr:hypothetical protein [Patescibacteria group bacterium]